MIKPQPSLPSGTIPYEQRLNGDRMWALREGSMHFERESAVFRTLERIARRLNELRIPYAIAGGMAAFIHGYRRFTEDVDILVTAEGLKAIHEHLEGRGYVPSFAGSKNLRDTDSGVRVEFLVTGGFPGDGKPKPVTFPDPETASIEIDGIRILSIERLIELKLVSGLVPGRRKDWGDVQELIRVLVLPRTLADRLDPSVRSSYELLWDEVQQTPEQP